MNLRNLDEEIDRTSQGNLILRTRDVIKRPGTACHIYDSGTVDPVIFRPRVEKIE